MRFAIVISGFLLAVGLALPSPSNADPCGLVPPLFWAGAEAGDQTPIQRIGVQRTYVFYKNGMETLALRPGFSGKVDEFGMLIPFPSPPAIRKLPDNVFEQIAAAIDPPEIVIDLRPQPGFGGGFGGGGGLGGGGGGFFGGGLGFVPKNEVRVIREEAIGMYEVAVLAAGSAQSLKRWMEDHKYKYPSGMDTVCPEYIRQRWCFVAVKTKVKQKDAAQPRPGQRGIKNDLPAGASFDGHVQAMGFRFRTRYLVVPMRLSVYNSSDLHNVVYLLSDKPSKIRHIPEKFVRRQVSGMKLFDQMTEPLPLRIIGGTIDDVPVARRRGLAVERDPQPHNGVAAELFASDIVAARTGRLESRGEAYEKDLLKINEALDLRGKEIDQDVRQLLFTERARMVRAALKAIDEMTLTVIDGDFPREVLARENLTFAEYHMPLEKSDRAHYDANKLGRADQQPGAAAVVGTLDRRNEQSTAVFADASRPANPPTPRTGAVWLTFLAGWITVGGIAAWRFPKQRTSVLLGGGLFVIASAALVAATSRADEIPTMRVLVMRLGKPDLAEQTVDQIVTLGEEAVPAMIKQSNSGDILRRGWAIVCLGRIGGDEAMSQLNRVYASESTPRLVKTWSAAAMIKAARSGDELDELAKLVNSHPSLGRPIVLAYRKQLKNETGSVSIEGLLDVGRRLPALRQGIAAELLSAGSPALTRVMLQSKKQNVRREAAGYLATLAQSPEQAEVVAGDVLAALKFESSAEQTPWHGGPLFIPGIQWKVDESRVLVGSLIRWHVWADQHEQPEARRQIANNLRSVALMNAAGYSPPSGFASIDWLRSWKGVVGQAEVKRLLAEQKLEEKYAALWDE